MCKEEKFISRFLQKSLIQLLSARGEYTMLLNNLADKEVELLVSENVFFVQTCSPSAAIKLENVPECKIMRLITLEMGYLKLFLPEEVVGILLHEIGHVFNPDKIKLEGEYAADNFAKEKGFKKWIISGLQNGLKMELYGFEKDKIDLRIENLNKT